jgi:hypothetical protein
MIRQVVKSSNRAISPYMTFFCIIALQLFVLFLSSAAFLQRVSNASINSYYKILLLLDLSRFNTEKNRIAIQFGESELLIWRTQEKSL